VLEAREKQRYRRQKIGLEGGLRPTLTVQPVGKKRRNINLFLCETTKAHRGVEVQNHLFLASALDGGMYILKKEDLLPMPGFES
jgi:hypothetical protein